MIGSKLDTTVPSDWKVLTVGDVGEYINGYAFKPEDWEDSGLPIIRIQNLNNPSKPFNYYQGKIEDKYLIQNGDILISWSASLGTFLWNSGDAWLNQHIFKAIPDELKIDRDFFYWAMVYAIERIAKNARGSTMRHVTGKEFKKSELAMPPVRNEQHRIAHVLNTVQTAIKQQARLIALTRKLKSALMRKLFTEGLRGEKQRETEIGPVPESWEIKPFEAFTILQRGKDLTKSEFKDGSIPVAGSNGVIGYHDTAFVKAPGVTVGRSGSVGKVMFYDQDFWAHNTSLYIKDFHDNDPRFAAYYLELMDLARFKTGASVPTLDRNSFKQIPIAVPPRDEQVEIGRILDTMDKKIEITNLRKAKLEELFRSLLRQLMTGQTRVNGIDLPGLS